MDRRHTDHKPADAISKRHTFAGDYTFNPFDVTRYGSNLCSEPNGLSFEFANVYDQRAYGTGVDFYVPNFGACLVEYDTNAIERNGIR
jgi:hypothetical protein